MTDAEIITEAESLTRQNTGISVAVLASWLNRCQKRLCRAANWQELIVRSATLTTTANTASYALGTGFDRFAGKSVLYNPSAITGGYQSGTPIPIILSTSDAENDRISGWRAAGAGTPGVITLGIATTLKAFLYPIPDTSSQVVLYDYVKAPTALTGLGVTPDVQAICGVLTMELAADILRFLGGRENLELRTSYLQDARREYNAALATLIVS